MKTKLFNAISLAVIMAMLVTSLAFADNLVGDGDGLVPVENDPVLNLGDVCVSQNASGNVLLAISRQGATTGTNTFGNGVTVGVSAGTPSNPSITRSFSDTSITLPSNWTGVTNGTISVDLANSGITVSASAPLGAKSGTILYSATGLNSGGSSITRTTTVTVNWSVINCDTTPPVITPNITGTLGNNGWYVSDVTVSWTVNDPESTVSSSSGCGSTTINSDTLTSGTTLTCSATSAGGTNSQSVTIKRDATAPGISFDGPSTSPWYTSDVTAGWACSDATSGALSSPVSGSTSGEGDSVPAVGTCEDNAGNTASDTRFFMVDKTAPSISGSVSPTANSNGWNNTDVSVTFTCGDGISGVASCGPNQTLSGEGNGQSVTGTALDNAGNSASATVSGINIDKTAPTASATASPAPNANGWNNTDVTVSFSGSDALSDIDFCDADAVLSSEGAGQSASGTCTDNAGNVSAPATVSGINIDKTAPVVAVTGVADDATYTLGSVPAAGCSTTDALSGVALAASLGTSGGPIGSVTVTCSGATDNAGNASGSVSATYNVIYNWNGFFQPIDNLPVLNKAKAGSAIPVKFSLSGYQGLNIFQAGSPVSSVTTCGNTSTDAIETTVTAGSSSLSYDATTDQYVYVWKTEKSWAGSCRTLTVVLNDGTIHQANFNFTK